MTTDKFFSDAYVCKFQQFIGSFRDEMLLIPERNLTVKIFSDTGFQEFRACLADEVNINPSGKLARV